MKSLNVTPDTRDAEMKEGFLDHCADLWDVNHDRFMALLKGSEQQAVKLTFTATIDLSDSEARLDVEIGYGQRFKDKRTRTFGDPDQNELPFDGRRPGTGLPEDGKVTEVGTEIEGTPAAFKEREKKRNRKSEKSKPSKKKD